MSCNSFRPNPMNVNDICRNCFQHKDTHPLLEPYSEEKMYRMNIENILYYSDTKQQSCEVNAYLTKLLHKLPPPEEYFKVFNVYSYVRQNLTNPEFNDLLPEEKLAAIYRGVDLLLLVALPLRRPIDFEKVAKLRKREPSLVKAEILEGTHDVIRKLGYTVITQDHYEFPPEINDPPDQTMIREIVADLKIALEEIKLYNYNTHPYPERFAEGSDWAKKTTPILPEIRINKDITDFEKRMTDVLAGREPQPQPYPKMPNFQSNATVAPLKPPASQLNNTVAPRMPFDPMYASVQPGVATMDRPGRVRLGTYDPPDPYKEIPPPIPEGMMQCPKDNCKKLIPKKSFVCPECRVYLSNNETVEPETPTLIPIESWNCINCTLTNTTAKGRPRVCEACDKVNPTNISTDVSPTSSIDQPPPPQSPRKYSGPEEPTAHPLIKQSLDLEPEQQYVREPLQPRNPSMNPLRNQTMNPPRNPSMNPPRNPSINPPRNPSMNPEGHQHVNPPGDYRGFNPREYPQQRGDPTIAPQGDWNAQVYQRYQPRDLDYPPQPHRQLDQPVYKNTRMDESYMKRNVSQNMPGIFPENPVEDTKERYPLSRNPSSSGIDSSLIPRKATVTQYPGPYGLNDMGYPAQPQGARMPYYQHPNPMPAPAPVAPYKFIKHIVGQNYGFKDEVLQLAIKKFGVHSCLDWLNTQFYENITMLTKDVRTFELCQTVTSKTVEENYIACHGVVPNVPPKIQDNRRNKLGELMNACRANEQLAISALEDTNWEVSAALDHIILLQNQQQLDDCRPYLWSGGMTIPERQPDEVDKEIWEQLELLAKNPAEMNNKISRKFLSELKIPSLIQLNLLLHLMIDEETKEKEAKDLLQAAQEVSDFDAALKFLNQQCNICYDKYTANEMIQMFFCNHMFCKSCVSDNFNHVVRNAAIKKWTCPECGEPDIQQMEDPSEYFGLLSTVVQALCEHDVTDLYHQKLNEFSISKRPEFRWCPHCHSGFLGQEGAKKLRCPQEECNQHLCYICKRKWEPEHEGRSCEEYQQWREANDRDILDKGLAAKLVEEGIECPSCKFKYELARGGCMHFRCTQCPAEFCSGCFQLFKKENCTKFASCAKKGLHAHHPRNCQYFTRDMEIVKMKELLEKGGFQRDEAVIPEPVPEGAEAIQVVRKKPQIYKVKVPEEHRKAVIEEMTAKMGDQFQEPPQGELKIPCQIVEYKDNPDGDFEKENCSKYSFEKDGYAGLCDKHYKEYLCGLITKAGLDPIDVLEVTEDTIFELFAILKRNEVPYDEKMKGDKLKLLIKEKLPLNPIDFRGALQA